MTVSETFSHVPRFSGVRDASALHWTAIVATALIHVAALLSIFQTEYGLFATALALLTWAFLNFFWLPFCVGRWRRQPSDNRNADGSVAV